MTISNLFGCVTGRFAGLLPLRILSTYSVVSRSTSADFAAYDISPPIAGSPLARENDGSRYFSANSTARWFDRVGCFWLCADDFRSTPTDRHLQSLSDPASFVDLVGQRKRPPGGAVMFGGNASERCGRSGSYSAVHNGPFTVNVVFELNNRELLITDYAFDKIAD